jgi:hypothetical protein
MKLNVGDRISLLKIIPIPKEGSRMTFKIIYDLISELSFSDKDYKDFKIIENEGHISWTGSKDKDIEIGEKATEIIQEALKELDKAEKLNSYLFILYEKFITDDNS